MKHKYELNFCEGCYFMATKVGEPNSIIENTLTEYIGEFECTEEEIQRILENLSKLKVELID